MRGCVDTNWVLESFWGQDVSAGAAIGVQAGDGFCRLSRVGTRQRFTMRMQLLGLTAGVSASLPAWLRRRLPISSYDFSTSEMPGGGIGHVQRSVWGPEPTTIDDFVGPCLFTTIQAAAVGGASFGVIEFNADGGGRKPVAFYSTSAGLQLGAGVSLLAGHASVVR